MRRTLTILAATALAAAVTIPAVAQDGGGQKPSFADFTSCLQAHGVAVPAGLDPAAVKQWLGEHRQQAGAALEACAPADDGSAALSSCLRSHGVDVASSPVALKRKVLELNGSAAGRATLAACKVSVDKPSTDPAPATNSCGGTPQRKPEQPSGGD